MDRSLVTIIIPVYNGADYLREAIDSSLAQTYSNFEVIVVNDGSNDGGRTREIALSYGDRIRYLEKENGGVASALNAGIRATKGKYISWLSHDDVYAPEKIERQVAVLEDMAAQGRKAIAYSSFLYIDERAEVIGSLDLPDVPPSKVYECMLTNTVFTSPFKGVPYVLHGCSVLCPRAAFDEVGLFDEGLPTTQDYDLWFKMTGVYDFVVVDGHLVLSREHEMQSSKVLRSERVDEIQDLYLRAFNMYRPGSAKYDLDLPRVVLALKKKGLKKAYEAARAELMGNGPSFRSWAYLIQASLTTKTSVRLQGLVKGAWKRAKWAFSR